MINRIRSTILIIYLQVNGPFGEFPDCVKQSTTINNDINQWLETTDQYDFFNVQGPGISDEYPACKPVQDNFIQWLEKTYPKKSEFEI